MNSSMEFAPNWRWQSHLQTRPERLWGPTSLHFNGHRGSFQGVKRPESDADNWPQYRAEAENEWSSISTPPSGVRYITWGKLNRFLILNMFALFGIKQFIF